MRILLIHQNFPGQYKHLGPALAARGDEVVALTPKVKKPIIKLKNRSYGMVCVWFPTLSYETARRMLILG